MLDIRLIREDTAAVKEQLSARGPEWAGIIDEALALDKELRAIVSGLQEAEAERNTISKAIGAAKKSGDEAKAAALMKAVADIKAQIENAKTKESDTRTVLDNLLAGIPNRPMPDVPIGADEADNLEISQWGTPKAFDFTPKDHVDIGAELGGMDFETAAKMSGARFVLLSGGVARLERALAAFMLDVQTLEHGYTETSPPYLVRDQALFGTGQLPKFGQDLFITRLFIEDDQINKLSESKTEIYKKAIELGPLLRDLEGIASTLQKKGGTDGSSVPTELKDALRPFLDLAKGKYSTIFGEKVSLFDEPDEWTVGWAKSRILLFREGFLNVLEEASQSANILSKILGDNSKYLIPTSEVPLTNIVRESILEDESLPRRYTANTPCFRSEAGSAGRDTRGMIRLHQFNKVELVSIVRDEAEGLEELERKTCCAETILERLELPYRRMLLCSGDMGFGARKTYDLEVWLPAQDTYREISSCSYCGDFQARRMDARWRPKPTDEIKKPKPEFVHTLNGSGLAVGRCLVAVLENYQNADGSVTIPEALVPYMGGVKVLDPA